MENQAPDGKEDKMEKKCIGIDIGGTTVKLGLFTVEGELLDKWEVPTRKEEESISLLMWQLP